MPSLFDNDFHAWASQQAGLLRGGRLADADIPHIVETLENDFDVEDWTW